MLETSARLLRLLTTLQGRRHWPGAELAERLEVTPRTLRRDVDRLRSLGYAVQAFSGPGGGYQLGTGSELPPLLLSDDEAVAVSVALRSATDTFTGVSDAAMSALVKLSQLLPKRLKGRVTALQAMTVSVGGAPVVPADRLVTLASACRDHELVRFEYTARGGAPQLRRVEPIRLAHAGARRWYLVGWDLDREALRTFRVDKLCALSVGPRFTPRPLPEDLERHIAESVAGGVHAYRARFRLSGSFEALASHVPSWLGALEPESEGTSVLTVNAETANGVASLIVFWGFGFELLGTVDGTGAEEVAQALEAAATRLQAGARTLASARHGG